MQTFLPYADFQKSAACLDWRRLNKQRVEAKQIYQCIRTPNRWKNHPAVLMWIGYENALLSYMNCCILEWVKRGYKNNMPIIQTGIIEYPWWFGDDRFHASHRSNLLRKSSWYDQFGWKENKDMPYFWPLKHVIPI